MITNNRWNQENECLRIIYKMQKKYIKIRLIVLLQGNHTPIYLRCSVPLLVVVYFFREPPLRSEREVELSFDTVQRFACCVRIVLFFHLILFFFSSLLSDCFRLCVFVRRCSVCLCTVLGWIVSTYECDRLPLIVCVCMDDDFCDVWMACHAYRCAAVVIYRSNEHAIAWMDANGWCGEWRSATKNWPDSGWGWRLLVGHRCDHLSFPMIAVFFFFARHRNDIFQCF